MPGRYTPANLVGQGGYRYGFNSKEKDDDFGGSTGAVYDYGFRIYDARIGKFLTVDPLALKYPWNSLYAFSDNRVIDGLEIEGLEVYLPNATKWNYGYGDAWYPDVWIIFH